MVDDTTYPVIIRELRSELEVSIFPTNLPLFNGQPFGAASSFPTIYIKMSKVMQDVFHPQHVYTYMYMSVCMYICIHSFYLVLEPCFGQSDGAHNDGRSWPHLPTSGGEQGEPGPIRLPFFQNLDSF